jgi:hypothetical protein
MLIDNKHHNDDSDDNGNGVLWFYVTSEGGQYIPIYNEKTGQQIGETFQNLMFDNSNNGTRTRIGWYKSRLCPPVPIGRIPHS